MIRKKRHIPDNAELFRRLPKEHLLKYNNHVNGIPIKTFRDREKKALSFDWAEYCSYEDTLERDGHPNKYELIKSFVKKIRRTSLDPSEFENNDINLYPIDINKPLR